MVRHGMSTEQGMPSCTCMTMPVATGVRLEASCFDLQLPDGRLEGGEAPEALCDERFQTSSGRVQVAAQELLGAVMPPVAAVPGPSLALDGTGSPAPPVQTQPSAGMAERAPKMFVVGAAAPQASDIGVVATEPTGAMAKEAHAVAHAWSKEEIYAFSRSFGNFDRVVAQGWLIGDALGIVPPMSREYAHRVGLKAGKEVKSIKDDVAADKTRVRKAARKLQPDVALPPRSPPVANGARRDGRASPVVPRTASASTRYACIGGCASLYRGRSTS